MINTKRIGLQLMSTRCDCWFCLLICYLLQDSYLSGHNTFCLYLPEPV